MDRRRRKAQVWEFIEMFRETSGHLYEKRLHALHALVGPLNALETALGLVEEIPERHKRYAYSEQVVRDVLRRGDFKRAKECADQLFAEEEATRERFLARLAIYRWFPLPSDRSPLRLLAGHVYHVDGQRIDRRSRSFAELWDATREQVDLEAARRCAYEIHEPYRRAESFERIAGMTGAAEDYIYAFRSLCGLTDEMSGKRAEGMIGKIVRSRLRPEVKVAVVKELTTIHFPWARELDLQLKKTA